MPNALASLFSAIDTGKRRLKAFTNDPVGSIGLGMNRFAEDQNSLQNLFANAYPMPGQSTVLNSPEQLAGFRAEAADQAANMGIAGMTSGKFVYPQDKALAIAQANAAKPVSAGGLGLHPQNTPAERAKAMGFSADSYHGTQQVFDNFDLAKSNSRSQYMPGAFTSDTPEIANVYGGDGVVMPLLQKNGYTVVDKAASRRAGQAPAEVDSIYDKAKGIRVTNNLSNIRSRFAAFDPARRSESDLLGRVDPNLLALIAAGGAGGAYLNRDKK